jgi:CO/xanthine dehydrogenase Mo-binding subunit
VLDAGGHAGCALTAEVLVEVGFLESETGRYAEAQTSFAGARAAADRLAGLLGAQATVAEIAPPWWGRYPFGPGDVALRISVTIEHLHAAVYAGRVVNRPGAELQNEGSMIMGLGTALMEEIAFADGQVTNANLSDYNIPAAGDLPTRLTHELIEREGAEVHGLGETALPPVPAAIGNALRSLGIRMHELPMTAERVLAAVDAR